MKKYMLSIALCLSAGSLWCSESILSDKQKVDQLSSRKQEQKELVETLNRLIYLFNTHPSMFYPCGKDLLTFLKEHPQHKDLFRSVAKSCHQLKNSIATLNPILEQDIKEGLTQWLDVPAPYDNHWERMSQSEIRKEAQDAVTAFFRGALENAQFRKIDPEHWACVMKYFALVPFDIDEHMIPTCEGYQTLGQRYDSLLDTLPLDENNKKLIQSQRTA